jgi:hypothetical protein
MEASPLPVKGPSLGDHYLVTPAMHEASVFSLLSESPPHLVVSCNRQGVMGTYSNPDPRPMLQARGHRGPILTRVPTCMYRFCIIHVL